MCYSDAGGIAEELRAISQDALNKGPMTNDLALTVKDALRGIRYAARKEVRLLDRGQAAFKSLLPGAGAAQDGRTAGRLSELAGALAEPFERLAQRIFESSDVARLNDNFLVPAPASLAALAADSDDTLFAASFYRGGSSCLAKMGVSNVLMSEQAILRAARPVARRHAEWLKRAARQPIGAENGERLLLIVADVTQAVIAAQPIRRVDRSAGALSAASRALADLNAHCFLAVGMATAVVSIAEAPKNFSVTEIMESAELAAAARYDQFAAALREANPAAGLAREFAAVVPYLP
jgi:hypothetical protein